MSEFNKNKIATDIQNVLCDYNSRPLISVVIPTYNRGKTIGYCLNSVLSQSYQNIEVVIVDDCSTDNTVEIVKSSKDSRIKLFVLEKNSGAQAARNRAIREAKGEWIVFLDSDDIILENGIQVRLDALEKYPDAAFIYGNVKIYDDTIVEFKNLNDVTKENKFKYLFKELSLCAFITIMAKKSAIEQIGYLDENYPAWQDDALVLAIAQKFEIAHCGCAVAKILPSDNQITSSYSKKYLGVKRIVEQHKNEIIKYCGWVRYFLWKLRILLNYQKANKRRYKLLEKFLKLHFEHIWG